MRHTRGDLASCLTSPQGAGQPQAGPERSEGCAKRTKGDAARRSEKAEKCSCIFCIHAIHGVFSRGHSRCGRTEGPNLSRVASHACSLRVLGSSSDESREPAISTGRTSSPEGDRGVHRTTGDTTNETSSMLRSSHELRGRQEPPYAEPHVRWCGRGPEDSGSLPDLPRICRSALCARCSCGCLVTPWAGYARRSRTGCAPTQRGQRHPEVMG